MELVDEQKELGQSQNPVKKVRKSFFQYLQSRRFARKTKRAIRNTLEGFGQEAKELRDMAYLFFRMLENKLDLHKRKTPPTAEEVKAAIDQLKDIGRISVFATISIIPGGGFSLIGLELLARKFGITNFTFLPSSFQKKNRKFKARSYGRLAQLIPKKKNAEKPLPLNNHSE